MTTDVVVVGAGFAVPIPDVVRAAVETLPRVDS